MVGADEHERIDPALEAALARTRPEVLIHQLTDLPPDLNPAEMPEALVRNARVRSEGTTNLMRAASKAGVRRVIAQSIAWLYVPGTEPHREEDPLAVADGAPAYITRLQQRAGCRTIERSARAQEGD